MELKTFNCSNCGGSIPLDSSIGNITQCPYCKSDFYIDQKWEASVKASTENTKQILVNNIRSIEIPSIQNKVMQQDLASFKRISESTLCLENSKKQKQEKIRDNQETIDTIENNVGLNYDEIEKKTPDVFGFFSVFAFLYAVFGVLVWIITTVQWFMEDDSIFALLLAPFFCIVWPLAIASSDPWVFIVFIFLAILLIAPIVIYVVQSNRKNAYLKKLDDLKIDLDLERIETRKLLIKENTTLSLEIQVLDSAISEIGRLKEAVGIYTSTSQFDGLSAAESIKKIDFALKRMLAAPIDFEIACVGFKADNEPVALPFEPIDNIAELIKLSLEHITRNH